MRIIVAGDFAETGRIASQIENCEYSSVFGEVKGIFDNADYSIVNLESPVCEKDLKKNAIQKDGPHLNCTKRAVESLKWLGVKCVTLANNHFFDYGEEGVASTIRSCEENNIDYVGGGHNIINASAILYRNIGDLKLAIINCCEHEFCIASENKGGCNPLNPVSQYYAICEAKLNADYVLVIVHGGPEHYQLPTPRMQMIYRFFVDAGADVVINHHQHCYSGFEIYHNKPIFYGIGNFCFDHVSFRNNHKWNYGYFIHLNLDELGIDFRIIPYTQCGNDVGVKLIKQDGFEGKINKLNSIISNSQLLNEETVKYYELTSKQHAYQILSPIFNEIWFALVKRGIVPLLISERRKLRVENFVRCESHRDKIMYYLDNSII